ncbi:MAG: carbohydrate ABC transporter permease [Candidatus Dormibacteria bacterium]
MSAVVAAQPPASVGTATRRLRLRRRLGRVVFNIVLGLIALFWLVPTFGLMLTSLRPGQSYFSDGWWTVFTKPTQLTLENYKGILSNGTIVGSLFTTVAISIPATILVVVTSALAAYSLVFGRWRGRDWVFIVIVALMVVPLQMALIPVSSLYRVLGLFGNILGVILFHAAFGLPFGIFLMRNFYTGIPRDLLEAARIDGAGEWTLFRRVVMPLGFPAMASLAIFQFIWVWNDLLVSLVFLGSSPNQPVTVALFSQLRQFGNNIDIISPAAFLSMVVPLIVFFAFQRYFVRGVLAGAVK